jgi:hypothetical protein
MNMKTFTRVGVSVLAAVVVSALGAGGAGSRGALGLDVPSVLRLPAWATTTRTRITPPS